MSTPDLVNGLLELLGAIMLMGNVVAIRESKCIKGVRWYPVAFFSVWGFWNLYFYPHLDQWLSFIGGLCMVVANMLWLGHVGYYWWTGADDDARGIQDSAE
ncbi:MAG: hypothetical protein AB7L09_02635 [Nitrospira sp.]